MVSGLQAPGRRLALLGAVLLLSCGPRAAPASGPTEGARGSETERAEVVGWHLLPARSYDSLVRADTPETAGLRPAEEPVQVAGVLEFQPDALGALKVSVDGVLLSAGRLVPDGESNFRVEALPDGPPPPVRLASGALALLVPPGPLGRHTVVAEVEGEKRWRREFSLGSRLGDLECLAIAHTFVDDVELATGNLVKRLGVLEDAGTELSADFCGHLYPQTTVGTGWAHTDEGILYQDTNPALPGGTRRYLLGSGTSGQTFTCTAAGCRNQAGYHGTAREVATPSGVEIVYRSLSGNEYRYGRPPGQALAGPLRLLERVSPLGERREWVYDTARATAVLRSVIDREARRQLDFLHEWPEGRRAPLLKQVEARAVPSPPSTAKAPAEKCARFEHDARFRVVALHRYTGPCDPAAEAASDLFVWADPPLPATALVKWTDSQKAQTLFEYETGELAGGKRFRRLPDGGPRVKAVVNPDGWRSELRYDLTPKTLSLFGRQKRVWETRVTRRGPDDARSLPQTTLYRLAENGAVARKIEVVGPGSDEVESKEWDPVHLKVLRHLGAAGARTVARLDDFGNVVEQRTASVGAAEPVVEKWAFDPGYAGETCRLSGDGTLTVTELDSDGTDPRRGKPQGTGVPLRVTQFATPVPLESAAGSASCTELAAQVPQTEEDLVTEYVYCGVRGGPCPAGARPGERVQTREQARGAATATALGVAP